MSSPDVVTFALPSGAKVTAPRPLAERMGWKPEPAPKAAPRRRKPATK